MEDGSGKDKDRTEAGRLRPTMVVVVLPVVPPAAVILLLLLVRTRLDPWDCHHDDDVVFFDLARHGAIRILLHMSITVRHVGFLFVFCLLVGLPICVIDIDD